MCPVWETFTAGGHVSKANSIVKRYASKPPSGAGLSKTDIMSKRSNFVATERKVKRNSFADILQLINGGYRDRSRPKCMGASYDRERKPDKQQPLAARNNCLLCKGNWYPWKTPKSRTSFFLSCGLPRSDAGNVRAVEVRLGSTFTLPQPSLADANNQQEYRIRSVALFFLFFQMVYLRSRRWMIWALLF